MRYERDIGNHAASSSLLVSAHPPKALDEFPITLSSIRLAVCMAFDSSLVIFTAAKKYRAHRPWNHYVYAMATGVDSVHPYSKTPRLAIVVGAIGLRLKIGPNKYSSAVP